MAAPINFPWPQTQDQLQRMSQELNDRLIHFDRTCQKLRGPALLASFLVISSLIVISGACLCLALPGVNVIQNVILPGVLPGCLGILLSIPFIIRSVKLTKEKTALFENELYPRFQAILNSALFDEAPRQIKYLEDYVLRGGNLRVYQDFWRTIFTKAIKEYGEQKKEISKRLDEVKEGRKKQIEEAANKALSEAQPAERDEIHRKATAEIEAIDAEDKQIEEEDKRKAAINKQTQEAIKEAIRAAPQMIDAFAANAKAEKDAIDAREQNVDQIAKRRLSARTAAIRDALTNLMQSEHKPKIVYSA